jgi:hypothetical protein
MANNRRPQAPKRRNWVAKNVNKVHRPQTFRDRTKYDRYEDYLKDQLDDMVDDVDRDEEAETKKKFVSAIAGDEYDPDGRKNYEEWLDAQEDDLDDWERWDYHGLDDTYDDYDDYEEYDD